VIIDIVSWWGSLFFITVRPDIAYVAGVLGRFSSNPTSKHWAAGLHVLKISSWH
jgi:hypothetical protein